jgi:hypothetical protein
VIGPDDVEALEPMRPLLEELGCVERGAALAATPTSSTS